MKAILFSIITLSLIISPIGVSATPMEEKVKNMMSQKSQISETKEASFIYWCLNDHLNKLTLGKIQDNPNKNIDEYELSRIGETIIKKFSSDENYFIVPPPSAFWDYAIYEDHILIGMEYNYPLKISKAQEILTTFNNILIDRDVMPEDTSSMFAQPCTDTLENILDTHIPESPKSFSGYKSFVNLRGDIVNVQNLSINPLLERGYLLYRVVV